MICYGIPPLVRGAAWCYAVPNRCCITRKLFEKHLDAARAINDALASCPDHESQPTTPVKAAPVTPQHNNRSRGLRLEVGRSPLAPRRAARTAAEAEGKQSSAAFHTTLNGLYDRSTQHPLTAAAVRRVRDSLRGAEPLSSQRRAPLSESKTRSPRNDSGPTQIIPTISMDLAAFLGQDSNSQHGGHDIHEETASASDDSTASAHAPEDSSRSSSGAGNNCSAVTATESALPAAECSADVVQSTLHTPERSTVATVQSVSTPTSILQDQEEALRQIMNDLDRTFPGFMFFSEGSQEREQVRTSACCL